MAEKASGEPSLCLQNDDQKVNLGTANISPEIAEEGRQDPIEPANPLLLEPSVITEKAGEPVQLQHEDQKLPAQDSDATASAGSTTSPSGAASPVERLLAKLTSDDHVVIDLPAQDSDASASAGSTTSSSGAASPDERLLAKLTSDDHDITLPAQDSDASADSTTSLSGAASPVERLLAKLESNDHDVLVTTLDKLYDLVKNDKSSHPAIVGARNQILQLLTHSDEKVVEKTTRLLMNTYYEFNTNQKETVTKDLLELGHVTTLLLNLEHSNEGVVWNTTVLVRELYVQHSGSAQLDELTQQLLEKGVLVKNLEHSGWRVVRYTTLLVQKLYEQLSGSTQLDELTRQLLKKGVLVKNLEHSDGGVVSSTKLLLVKMLPDLLDSDAVDKATLEQLLPTVVEMVDDPEFSFSFYKKTMPTAVMKYLVQVDKENEVDFEEKLLRLVYKTLQGNVKCTTKKKSYLYKELDAVTFNKLSTLLESYAKDKVHNIRSMVAAKILSEFFKGKDPSLSKRVKKWLCIPFVLFFTFLLNFYNMLPCKSKKKYSTELQEKEKKNRPSPMHRCKAISGRFANILLVYGMYSYIFDLATDVIVGIDDLGRVKALGILEIFLVVFTLLHENVRSVISLYGTEEELVRMRSCTADPEKNEWREYSDLNCPYKWDIRGKRTITVFGILTMVFWPFKFQSGINWINVKVFLFNLLSIVLLRPLVDRLVVLVHPTNNYRFIYRKKAEQNNLKQFYFILEQLPELIIQLYSFQRLFLSSAKRLSLDNSFCNFIYPSWNSSNTNMYSNITNFYSPYVTCNMVFRGYSMSFPLFGIPVGILALEESVRKLDPILPNLTSTSKYLIIFSYFLLVPSRLFLVSGFLRVEKVYIIVFITLRIILNFIVNVFFMGGKRFLINDSASNENLSIVKRLGNFWGLLLFSIRDLFVISLRDPEGYIKKVSEVSEGSLRSLNRLLCLSVPYLLEGLIGAVVLEYNYPEKYGLEDEVAFAYVKGSGWFCLVILIAAIMFLLVAVILMNLAKLTNFKSLCMRLYTAATAYMILAVYLFGFSKVRSSGLTNAVVFGCAVFNLVLLGLLCYCYYEYKSKQGPVKSKVYERREVPGVVADTEV